MLYPVLQTFQDKFTHEVHDVGSFYKTKDRNRANDLQELGFLGEGEAEKAPEKWPKHIAGGNYELSNGEKVKGKEEAIAAQQAIEAGGSDESE